VPRGGRTRSRRLSGAAEDAARLSELLAGAGRVVTLTGAGISTDSGVPDFRGPKGLWTMDPSAERLTHWPSYRDEPEVRHRSWLWRVRNHVLDAVPNAAHRALARLVEEGRLSALATQNVDGLHVAAGTPVSRVHELHGSLREVLCPACGWSAPMLWAVERVTAGDVDPRCPECNGITKAGTVFFGETMPQDPLRRSSMAAIDADLFLAIGTSLTVQPAAGLPELAVKHGARLVIVNAEPTPLDHLATLIVRTPIGEVLPVAVDDVLS